MTAEEIKTIERLTEAVDLDATFTALVCLKLFDESERNPLKIPEVVSSINDARDIINKFLNCFKSNK